MLFRECLEDYESHFVTEIHFLILCVFIISHSNYSDDFFFKKKENDFFKVIHSIDPKKKYTHGILTKGIVTFSNHCLYA